MTKKLQPRYVCSNCGHIEPKWAGRCPQCGEWNTFDEQVPAPSSATAGARPRAEAVRPRQLDRIEAGDTRRIATDIGELDRVLGGGIMAGSSVLLGGEPGIGKSTLMLQAVAGLANRTACLYVAGEEAEGQIKARADRLGLGRSPVEVLATGSVEHIEQALVANRPRVVVIDSIQTLFSPEAGSSPGSVSQIKYGVHELSQAARTYGASLFLVAHVTKEGSIAGPKQVEHLVDAVLYFEEAGDQMRFLRATKNRFGSTDEVGLFSMGETGLSELLDPSGVFLVQREGGLPPGVVVAPVYEGSRILMVEIQALTVPAKSGVSRTYSDRIDTGRVSRVAAVLEKHVGVSFSDQDLYVNVAGGMRIAEVGIELPLAMALYSARTGKSVPKGLTVTGELSLAGEVRPVGNLARRVRAAAELGFTRTIGPQELRTTERADGIRPKGLSGVRRVGDCVNAVFGSG